MHTRRLAAFLAGAWLFGCLLIGLVLIPSTQRQAEAILSAPPLALAKDIEDMGADVVRLMLNYQAAEVMRLVYQTWGVAQLGIAAGLLATVSFTAHRSKFLIGAAVLMAVLVCLQTLYLVPALRATGRTIDFVPLAANSPARESNHSYQVWYQVLEVLKLMAGFALAGRLVFDFYAWKDRVGEPSSGHGQHRRRRRKRTRDGSVAEAVKPTTQADTSLEG